MWGDVGRCGEMWVSAPSQVEGRERFVGDEGGAEGDRGLVGEVDTACEGKRLEVTVLGERGGERGGARVGELAPRHVQVLQSGRVAERAGEGGNATVRAGQSRSEQVREGHGRKEEIWGDGAPEGVCEGGDATVGDARTALEAQRREARAPA